MMLATPTGNRAAFALFDSSVPIPRHGQYGNNWSYAGRRVSWHEAVGLPAFMRGVRLIAETTAMMPFSVHAGHGSNMRPVDARQLAVLRRPNPDMAPFQVWSFAVASMLRGGAYLRKVKTRRGIEALYPIPPRIVTPKIVNGRLEFHVRAKQTGATEILTRADVLYIPGILVDDPIIGASVVEAFRHGIGTALARQEFEGRYLANDGTPGVVLKNQGNPDELQRQAIRDSYEAKHQGPRNAGRPALLWGGWDIDKIAVSLEDAQFIESQAFQVQDVARMLGIPSGFLGDPQAPGSDDPERENMRFLQFGLAPWMTRLEQGLALDPDLFPNPELQVELDPSHLLRADTRTLVEAAHRARQAGVATANELRPHMPFNLTGDHPDGDVLLATPVGGAPNEPAPPAA